VQGQYSARLPAPGEAAVSKRRALKTFLGEERKMNSKEIKKARHTLEDAGTVADRQGARSFIVEKLRSDAEVLGKRILVVVEEYRSFVATWLTVELPAETKPVALSDDSDKRRKYLMAGILALLVEMGLAGAIFALRGVPWWIGALGALGLTLVLDAALHIVLFGKTQRPKESLRKLKRYVIAPAFAGLLLAVALVVLARYVEGTAAVKFLVLFSLALWLLTMSFMVLAAALFCAAHLYGTTERLERKYLTLEYEERITKAFLAELEVTSRSDGARALPSSAEVATPVAGVDGRPTARPVGSRVFESVGTLLPILALIILGACSSPQAGATPQGGRPTAIAATTQGQPETAAQASVCEVIIDGSGSVVGLEEVWKHVREELPMVVETLGCISLAVSSFNVDGWLLTPLKELQLPVLEVPEQQRTSSEWMSFTNFRDAVAQEEERRLSRARQAHSTSVREALRALEGPILGSGDESPGSDVVGVLRRLSQVRDNRPRYVLLITDGADTRYRRFPAIPAPSGNVHVLVLLAPAKPNDARFTFGKALPASEQWEVKSKDLKRAVPWAKVVPYFSTGLAQQFGSSKTQSGS
jgi:hypothetical protein